MKKDIFNGKVAIVTGGASGIGQALVEKMASMGTIAIIADVDITKGEKLASRLVAEGKQAFFHKLDVSNEEEVYQLVSNVSSQFGRLDFMFNNAGISSMSEFDDITSQQWKKIIDINLLGVVYGSTAAYKVMKEQGHGYIVNTSSAAAFGPAPLSSSYGTTKHAVLSLTTSLHYEAMDYGVKVSAVCPAFVTTPIMETMEISNFDREVFTKNAKNYISSEKCAEIILKGIEKEELIITTIGLRKTTSVLFTIFPGLQRKLMKLVVQTGRKARIQE